MVAVQMEELHLSLPGNFIPILNDLPNNQTITLPAVLIDKGQIELTIHRLQNELRIKLKGKHAVVQKCDDVWRCCVQSLGTQSATTPTTRGRSNQTRPVSDQPQVTENLGEELQNNGVKRGRGRPRKLQRSMKIEEPVLIAEKPQRGRPRRSVTAAEPKSSNKNKASKRSYPEKIGSSEDNVTDESISQEREEKVVVDQENFMEESPRKRRKCKEAGFYSQLLGIKTGKHSENPADFTQRQKRAVYLEQPKGRKSCDSLSLGDKGAESDKTIIMKSTETSDEGIESYTWDTDPAKSEDISADVECIDQTIGDATVSSEIFEVGNESVEARNDELDEAVTPEKCKPNEINCPKCGIIKGKYILHHVNRFHEKDIDFQETLTLARASVVRKDPRPRKGKMRKLREKMSEMETNNHTCTECLLCHVKFAVSNNLIKHIKTKHHVGWNNYQAVERLQPGTARNEKLQELRKSDVEKDTAQKEGKLKELSDSGQGWVCEKCAKSYNKSQTLKTHLMTIHGKDSDYLDQLLALENKIEKKYAMPGKSKSKMLNEVGLITCPYCDLERVPRRIAAHLHQFHSKEPDFKDNFEKINKQLTHIRSRVRGIKTKLTSNARLAHHRATGKVFKCLHCDKTYKHESSRSFHQNYLCQSNDNRNTKIVCSRCHFVCDSPDEFAKHKLKHKLEKYCCDSCGNVYATSSSLSQHKRFVHGIISKTSQEEYRCKVCLKMFITKTHLKKHLTTHSDERNFVCDFCGKQFRHPDTLKRHTKVNHLQQNHYMCTQCNFTAASMDKIKGHNCQPSTEGQAALRSLIKREPEVSPETNVEPITLRFVQEDGSGMLDVDQVVSMAAQLNVQPGSVIIFGEGDYEQRLVFGNTTPEGEVEICTSADSQVDDSQVNDSQVDDSQVDDSQPVMDIIQEAITQAAVGGDGDGTVHMQLEGTTISIPESELLIAGSTIITADGQILKIESTDPGTGTIIDNDDLALSALQELGQGQGQNLVVVHQVAEDLKQEEKVPCSSQSVLLEQETIEMKLENMNNSWVSSQQQYQ